MSPVIIIVPVAIAVVFCVLRFLPQMYRLKAMAEKDFICPNCGHRFRVKWYRLIFKYMPVGIMGCAPFRCPKCREKDQCTWSGSRD